MVKQENVFFRHCDKPTISPVQGIIKGTVPTWLNGTLTRNGPGIQKVGEDIYKHMFDGLAIIHRFHIDNGVVTYNNRPLQSDIYHKNMAENRITTSAFGTIAVGDPCDTLFNKFKTLFVAKEKKEVVLDNCDVNVTYYGDQLYAMTETTHVRQIDPVTLESIGDATNIAGYIAVNMASAHPHVLEDGTILNLGVNFRHKKGSCYLLLQVPPTFGSKESNFKDIKILAEIPSRWRFYPGYAHSFGITKDKFIFIEQPFCLSIPRMILAPLKPVANVGAHTWYPKEKTRIHVVSISSGQIHPVVYETDNLFVFHHANAYEKNGNIVMDVAGYDSGDYVCSGMDNDTVNSKPRQETGASTRRYVLPLDVSSATPGTNLLSLSNCTASATLRNVPEKEPIVDLKPEILHDNFVEFPRVNYKYNGLKYKYIYGVKSSAPRESAAIPEPDILMKLNTETHEIVSWKGENVYVAEPIFVPNPNVDNPAEDDGIILSNLLHANDQMKTTLLILDAKTMTELASVEFRTEGVVSGTFHGQWATTGEKVHSN